MPMTESGAAAAGARAPTTLVGQRGRQFVALLKLEMRRLITARNTVGFVVFAAFTLLPFVIFALFGEASEKQRIFEEFPSYFAQVFAVYFLHVLTFLGVASIFGSAFREDMLHRTLHYYFLVPIPRWLLLLSKYFAAVLLCSTIVGGAVTVSFISMEYLNPAGGLEQFLYRGDWAVALQYVGISSLACASYGALFLMAGLFVRNVAYPTVILITWEFLNFLLPPFLKNFSLVYHLQSLSPVPVREGAFALMAEPTPAWLAISGLLVGSMVCLSAAALRLRSFEVRYDDRE